MKIDLLFSLLVKVITIVFGLLSYKLAVIYFGLEGFSEYSLSKRIISLLYSIFLLGLGVAIPRYLSMYKDDRYEQGNFFFSGLILIFISNLVLMIILMLMREKLALFFFSSEKYAHLIFPIGVSISGMLWHASVFSYFRGNLEFLKANILQLVNLAIIPITAFFLSSSVYYVFLVSGILTILVSGIVIIKLILEQSVIQNLKMISIVRNIKMLITYGLGRVIGDVGLAMLFSTVPILSTQMYGIKVGGIVSFSISMLNLLASFFSVIGIVLLPKLGLLYSTGKVDMIRNYTIKITIFAVLISISIVFMGLSFGRLILNYFISDFNSNYWDLMRLSFLAIVPYSIYIVLRSVIDAIYSTPYNALNVFISLFVLFVLSGFIYIFQCKYYYLMYSLLFSLSLLAFLTLVRSYSAFRS